MFYIIIFQQYILWKIIILNIVHNFIKVINIYLLLGRYLFSFYLTKLLKLFNYIIIIFDYKYYIVI